MLSKEDIADLFINDVSAFNKEFDGKAIDLSEVDFSGTNVEGAVFDNADLTSSSFADSHLVDVKFLGCDLTSVDFNRATLVECSFNESVLNGTDFSYGCNIKHLVDIYNKHKLKAELQRRICCYDQLKSQLREKT